MSAQSQIDSAYTLMQYERNMKQQKLYLQANNLDQRQLDRVLKPRFFGPIGSLTFGRHWMAAPDLSLEVSEGRPYRYLDYRLVPWKHDLGDAVDYVELKKKKGVVKKGVVNLTWKLGENNSPYLPSAEENYRLGRLEEFPVEIKPPCQCGISAKHHLPAPPAPKMARTWSDPLFAVRRPVTAGA